MGDVCFCFWIKVDVVLILEGVFLFLFGYDMVFEL